MKNFIQVLHFPICKYFSLLLLLNVFVAINPVVASDIRKMSVRPKAEDLKIFEGYYQLEEDHEMYIQVMVKQHQLVLKQLWDNKEIEFRRKSELEFNADEHFTLVFSKGSNGAIINVVAFGRDKWNKVKNYAPVEKKPITLSEDQLKDFEGKYKLKDNANNLFLEFSVKGGELVAKEIWSGKEIIVLPSSPNEFFGKAQRYPLKFQKDAKGKVTAALIFSRDVWEKVN